MALYKYEVKLDDCFIRYINVFEYHIKKANEKAINESKELYPNTYNKLTTELIYCSEPGATCNKQIKS